MHDRPVRAGAGDGREGDVLERAGLAAEAFQRLDRVDFAQAAGRRLDVEPGEEARHGGAVAPVRGARAVDLGAVLHRLHQRDRIGAAHRLAAGVRDQPRQRVGGARLVEADRLALEAGEVACKPLRRAHVGDFFQRVSHGIVELAGLDIERRAVLRRHQREAERQRRVRHIRAADIEQPVDVLRIGHHQRVGAQFGKFAARALELFRGAFAGEFDVTQDDRRRRRLRPAAPQRVDRIIVDRNQRRARAGAGNL